MQSFKDKVAVITGAGSGIGRELALQLSARGCRLAIADYNKKGLTETARLVKQSGGAAMHAEVNVADLKQVSKFARDVIKKYGQADIVINNAGVTLFGKLDNFSYKDIKWITDINFWGVVYGSKEFMPYLKERPEAAIVNISSAFGLIGVPSQTAYCATKFAVRGLTESLRRELKSTAIAVSCVHPGGIKTNIARNARFSGNFSKDAPDKFARRFEKVAGTTAAKAAETIINGIAKKKKRILIGGDAKLIDVVQRLFPVGYGALMDLLYK